MYIYQSKSHPLTNHCISKTTKFPKLVFRWMIGYMLFVLNKKVFGETFSNSEKVAVLERKFLNVQNSTF